MFRSKRSRRGEGPRPRRTWPQRLLITFNVGCILLALVGAGALAYTREQVGQIDRIAIGDSSFRGTEGLADTDPRNFLIVGEDSSDGLASDDQANAGRDKVGGVRSDTIMVVRVDPETTDAKVLSFPRDLWVDIPGNSRNRINASLEFGGAELLIDTLKANFDIDINHYVQIDFAGFRRLVDIVDGVPVYFESPTRDGKADFYVETPGCHTLGGVSALEYVRSRELRYQNENGRWVGDPTADHGRISRQQDFIKRVMRRAIDKGARNPVTLSRFIDAGTDNLTLDDNTTVGDLVSLGSAFRNFDPDALATYSLPVSDVKTRGGAEVLDLQVAEAEPILALFRGTGEPLDPDTLSPATVPVQVLNGSGAQDQAAEASAVLSSAGFKTDQPTSAPLVERTEVHYTPGMEAQAVLVARHLFADPVLVPDIEVSQITVVTGPDFRAALLDPRPSSDFTVPTTTTTPPVFGGATVDPDDLTGPEGIVEVTTTTTTEPKGFVPDAAPPGAGCG